MQKGQLQIRKQGYLREDLYDEDSGKPIKFTSWVGGKMEEDKKRLDYMDIAKGFGIICVIVGHMGYRALDRVIFSFHMPLFFLISGYFLDEKRRIDKEKQTIIAAIYFYLRLHCELNCAKGFACSLD